MSDRTPATSSFWDAALSRGLAFLTFWLILSLGNPSDVPVGVLATLAATWASLRLLPPGPSRLSFLALMAFALRFLRQSVLAGIDVAWRAFDPRMPLRTGFIAYRSQLRSGPGWNAFCTLESLLPGTMPVGSARGGVLLFHCLDTDQPVVAQVTRDEELFRRALGQERDDG